MPNTTTLPAFSASEREQVKILLATQVASMMGRKLEEEDWGSVYCKAKNIPKAGWSNLHIDVNYLGLGVEQKLLRCTGLKGNSIKTVCGTTMMHPAATRSIRIDNVKMPPNVVMKDVFKQYAQLIRTRTDSVGKKAAGNEIDMRTGWLLWEDSLSEFLYFEERMLSPDPAKFYAEWHITKARGIRKPSVSLWIYEKSSNKKTYSVTTSAGIKIQPYFNVPAPSDPNLYYFRVQSEQISADTVQLWISATTAAALTACLGDLSRDVISDAVLSLSEQGVHEGTTNLAQIDRAVPVQISTRAYNALISMWETAVSDEHRAQLLVKSISLPNMS